MHLTLFLQDEWSDVPNEAFTFVVFEGVVEDLPKMWGLLKPEGIVVHVWAPDQVTVYQKDCKVNEFWQLDCLHLTKESLLPYKTDTILHIGMTQSHADLLWQLKCDNYTGFTQNSVTFKQTRHHVYTVYGHKLITCLCWKDNKFECSLYERKLSLILVSSTWTSLLSYSDRGRYM